MIEFEDNFIENLASKHVENQPISTPANAESFKAGFYKCVELISNQKGFPFEIIPIMAIPEGFDQEAFAKNWDQTKPNIIEGGDLDRGLIMGVDPGDPKGDITTSTLFKCVKRGERQKVIICGGSLKSDRYSEIREHLKSNRMSLEQPSDLMTLKILKDFKAVEVLKEEKHTHRIPTAGPIKKRRRR